MNFGDVEVSLTPMDVEREIKEVRVIEIKPTQTKYGLRYLGRVKDTKGEKWLFWMGDKEIQLIKSVVRKTNRKDEEGLILSLGTESYTNKDNISKVKIVIKNIRTEGQNGKIEAEA